MGGPQADRTRLCQCPYRNLSDAGVGTRHRNRADRFALPPVADVDRARSLRRDPYALAAVAPMARCAPIEDRIVSILDAGRRRGRLGRVAHTATVVLAAGVLLPLAALQPVARTQSVEPAPVATPFVCTPPVGGASECA